MWRVLYILIFILCYSHFICYKHAPHTVKTVQRILKHLIVKSIEQITYTDRGRMNLILPSLETLNE